MARARKRKFNTGTKIRLSLNIADRQYNINLVDLIKGKLLIKIIANWIISLMVYTVISFVLSFVLIGLPLLFALGIIGVVFPVIGGIKASNGEAWTYPLSIKFMK